MMLIVVVHFDLELEQLDVKTAFLHGDLDELIYMKQFARYIDTLHPKHIRLLKKSLYRLKQSPRQWYKKFDNFATEIGFTLSKYGSCFYYMLSSILVYLILYVDDILLISKCKSKICELKSLLNTNFEMKDLGLAKKILGMIVERDKSKNSLKIH